MKQANHQQGVLLLLLLSLLLLITHPPAPRLLISAQQVCSVGDALTLLKPCLPAVTGGSGSPSQACCSNLAAVGIECICSVLATPGLLPDGFSADLASKLPVLCGLTHNFTC